MKEVGGLIMAMIYKGEIQRLFPILEAIKEGKTIQYKDTGVWRDIDGDDEGFCLGTLVKETDSYRIKPEPIYRPFKDKKECWDEMQKHQPFGWIRNKFVTSDAICTIVLLDSRKSFRVYTSSGNGNTSEEMMDSFVFADGTPFGVKVGE